ncbi:MAG: hypothetical protein ABWW65_02090 [Thermoprotei archaeon]
MDICIVYYSKTGKTRRVIEYFKEKISSAGYSVKVFFIRPAKEYFNKFLHLNPRILYEVFAGKVIDITGDEELDLNNCSALLIASPVWWGAASPPIYSFIHKYSGSYKGPVYCITTADLRIDYASKLRKELEKRKYRVVDCLSVVDPEKDIDKINKFIDRIISDLTSKNRDH